MARVRKLPLPWLPKTVCDAPPPNAAPASAPAGEGGVNLLTATYLNRLSDLLFILSRSANEAAGGDVLWVPGGGRDQAGESEA